MDLREAIDSESEYQIPYKGVVLYFTLRDPTNAEDLEYRRRSGKTSFKSGNFTSKDEALNAALWLLEQIKLKVEYSNGSDERKPVVEADYKDITPRPKLSVIQWHIDQLAGEVTETLKN